MKKFIFILFFSLFTINTLESQVLISLLFGDNLNTGKIEFGLDGGMTLSDQTGLSDSKMLNSWNLGFYFDIKLKDDWMLHTGVLVKSTSGADEIPVYSLQNSELDNLYATGSIERNMSYFNVPILMKYNFKNRFYVEAGPQLGLLYKATDEFQNKIDGNELTYSKDVREEFHPLDAGVVGGVGYRILKGYGMNIAIRYYYGFVDVLVNDSGDAVTNQSLYFNVGIPIGVGKALKRAEEKKKAEQKQ
ncbi:MAG TPA: porin family protein [Flavobacterium sp.]|nr:porin family protein [Flavobacterium sp.]HRZ74438.1 porin family protein [Flavobacterium sp.]